MGGDDFLVKPFDSPKRRRIRDFCKDAAKKFLFLKFIPLSLENLLNICYYRVMKNKR